MWPADITFYAWIARGINVFATAGIKVKPLDTGLGDDRVILIPNHNFRIAFNRIIRCMTGARALLGSQLFSSQENRFDFLIAKTGAGFIFVLGVCFCADQAHQYYRKHGYSKLQAEFPAGNLKTSL